MNIFTIITLPLQIHILKMSLQVLIHHFISFTLNCHFILKSRRFQIIAGHDDLGHSRMIIIRIMTASYDGYTSPIRILILIFLIINITAAVRWFHIVTLLHLMLAVRVVHIRILGYI